MPTEITAALLALLTILGGLLGVIWGTRIAANRAQESWRLQRQTETTLLLYQNFQSTEMLQSRILADQYLKENFESDKRKLHELGTQLRLEKWEHISRVRHFFAQLQVLMDAGMLNSSLAERLFSAHVGHWFYRYFRHFEAHEDITPHWRATREKLVAWGERSKPADA